ncbi:MAG: bactofilin family protein, partial [Gemmatimonadota bacterium]
MSEATIRAARGALPALVAFVALVVSPGRAAAQEADPIRFDPRSDHPAERQFEAFLDRAAFTRIETDTVIGPDERVDGDLLILEADVRLSGTVTGDVVAVGGDVFLRPGSRIEGSVLILGGGFYSSQRAEIAGEFVYRPNDVYAVERTPGEVRIRPVRDVPEALTLHGLSGILFPTYQRVDEWTLGLGATVRHVGWGWQPSLEGRLRLKTEHGDLEGTLRQAWYPNSALTFGVEAERVTRTNESWIRGDIANTLSYFFAGDDFRNYYETDRVALYLRGSQTAMWSPIVEVQWEDARSLEASDQFVLFASDEGRPNPAIDEGESVGARLGMGFRRATSETSLQVHALLEGADADVAGDFSYLFGELQAAWAGPAAIGHSVEAFLLVRGDLSGTLPRQRWSAVGGLASIPTLPTLAERGARLAYGEVTYLIPVERF